MNQSIDNKIPNSSSNSNNRELFSMMKAFFGEINKLEELNELAKIRNAIYKSQFKVS